MQNTACKTEVISDLDKAITTNLQQQAESAYVHLVTCQFEASFCILQRASSCFSKNEISNLEARVHVLTLEKTKLMEELNDLRKCLLDFNKIKEFMVYAYFRIYHAPLYSFVLT